MDPFIAQLKSLCATHPTRAKWVFVPTHAIGRTLGDRLVLGGTDWANLRFVTPLDVALRMGAPFLVEHGIDPSEEARRADAMLGNQVGLTSETSNPIQRLVRLRARAYSRAPAATDFRT